MDFDDLRKGHKDKYHHHERQHLSHGGYGHDLARHLSRLQQLSGNKGLLLVAGGLLIFLLLLAIGAFILLLPTLGKLLGLVEAKGIRGLLEALLPVAERIWRGSGV